MARRRYWYMGWPVELTSDALRDGPEHAILPCVQKLLRVTPRFTRPETSTFNQVDVSGCESE